VAAVIDPAGDGFLAGFACFLVSLVAWLIFVVVLQNSAIRVTEFSTRAIRLTNVCRKFADAYEDQLDQEEEERYAGRRDLDRSARERWDDRRPARPPRDRSAGPLPRARDAGDDGYRPG
jgi:hypothetical protein